MRVLGESWCFCNGGGKSERMKAGIFSGKAPAMARINGGATGFLIHRNLLVTTHANLPSVAAAEASEIRLHNGLSACLFPHRFFSTSSVLDLTMVGLEVLDGESNAPVLQYLKTSSKPNLELGCIVYLLGYTEKQELTVGEGKVVIATDNLIKLSTDGITWSPGSAGFDVHGNLAFMVCDPMKLATSPNTKSSSTSSSSTSSCKKDFPMQFGIPIPVIRDLLRQHWEGNLDKLNKPKLPLMRLMSSGQKSEHSCASFTMRQVFKSTEGENEASPTSSNIISRPIEQPGPSSAVVNTLEDENFTSDPLGVKHAAAWKKDISQIQLLDINFPPRIAKPASSPKQSRNYVLSPQPQEVERYCNIRPSGLIPDAESTGSVDGDHIRSISSPIEISELPAVYSSDGETTMYSAETAESRNYPSPRGGKFHQVGRSQSCVNYNRWGMVHKNPVAQGTKVHSQSATSQRSNDYYGPTVSSIMKKRNNLEQQNRPRQSAVHTSPRWMF